MYIPYVIANLQRETNEINLQVPCVTHMFSHIEPKRQFLLHRRLPFHINCQRGWMEMIVWWDRNMENSRTAVSSLDGLMQNGTSASPPRTYKSLGTSLVFEEH